MRGIVFDSNTANKCRKDFPSLSRKQGRHTLAYFDGPGGTQMPVAVIRALINYCRLSNSNIHGMFVTSRETDEMIMASREAFADFFGVPGPDGWKSVSFGANMTTLCFSLSRALGRSLGPGDEVVITELDHEANRGPWLAMKRLGVEVKEVRLLEPGVLDYDDMREKITGRTKIVAIGMSSNALGTANDVALARRLASDCGAFLVLDAVHYAPHYPIDVVSLDPDFLLCSSYKFYGPHLGILYSRPGLLDKIETERLSTQEPESPYRIETGTLSHEAIVGARAAVDYIASLGSGVNRRERIVSAMTNIAAYEHDLARRYYAEASRIPGVRVWGTSFDVHRAPTVSITIDGITPELAARRLAELGLCLWDGDFYAARAIDALGLRDAGGVLRMGVSLYNTDDEIDRLLVGLASLRR